MEKEYEGYEMRKSNYGFNLWFYPAIAFVLAIFGQTLLCGLITIFAIAAERDEWTSRQTMEAFFLGLVNALVSVIVGLFGIVTWIPFWGQGSAQSWASARRPCP